ncbi:glycosyltransferase [Mucilaginibacter jinjuensis]|uniref:Glycosyltransferase n=1 Tax=Mucilaginibacter jinjuensis TaxID=1176721 RepID=A0ABY7TD59_9SPHI|nr:glycosyltransferase [Mucilaginibacter jinjuensis]WCT14143.1 glycosyltransferase [Mucilaginibacter jinjuensis]
MDLQIQEVLLGLLGICFIIQMVYLLAYQNKLNAYNPLTELPEAVIPVSVVISARNEIENLTQNLPAILNQNYPDFEVIVVNDCSFDGSAQLLEELEAQYPRLKVVTVTETRKFKTGKKFALTMGIKAAKNDCLLFTDADCVPASDNWIAFMAANFANPETQIVLGYSPYYRKRGLLNSLIRFETIKTAINYLSAAMRGNAYMGVGRNLAYRKELFFSVKGFASHMHIMSGDDDLFVNQNATPANTVIELHQDSFIFSEPKTSFGAWGRQKRRHAGAGKLYKAKHKRMLATDAVSGLLFYLLFFSCLAAEPAMYIAVSLFIVRWLAQILVYKKQFTTLQGKDFIWYIPIADTLYYLYLNIFGLVGTLKKTNQWK